MPEISNFKFTLKEVAEALLREQRITAGLWSVGFDFNVAIGNFGLENPSEQYPGSMVRIVGVNLSLTPESPADAMVLVDASKLAREG